MSDTDLRMALEVAPATFSVEVVDTVGLMYGLSVVVDALAAKALVATDVVVDAVVGLFALVLMAVEASIVTDMTAVKIEQECLDA